MERFIAFSFLVHIALNFCLASVIVPGVADELDFYVSAPWLRPPLFEIIHVEPEKVSPGYWFLAPYYKLPQASLNPQLEVCQIGPNIFDNHGQLLWSGACDYYNSNAFDFKVWSANGSAQLSFIVGQRMYTSSSKEPPKKGVILDPKFKPRYVRTGPEDKPFNMHEFSVLDNGRRAIMFREETGIIDTPSHLNFTNSSINIWEGALVEVDLTTREVVFEWPFLENVPVAESSAPIPKGGGVDYPWDWIHPNSVDKDGEGNYLLSARFMDCIYKISGQDGSIIWRLGGKNSSFEFDGFNFSRQHDARFQGTQDHKTLISLFNNAGDEKSSSGHISEGYLIELDTDSSPMTAKLLKRWGRPDRQRSRARGNLQMLENGNVFIGWGDNGYITEFDESGNVVLEAKLVSDHFVNYRAQKFDFIGRPDDSPKIKAVAYNTEAENAVTIIYVSWNGATEIAWWNFYAKNLSSSDFELIGKIEKTKFESTLAATGYHRFVYAEALSADEQAVGKSIIQTTEATARSSELYTHPENENGQSYKSDIGHVTQSGTHAYSTNSRFYSWISGNDQVTNYIFALTAGLSLGVIMTSLTMKARCCSSR